MQTKNKPKSKSFSLTVPYGKLIAVKNLPNKYAYNKGQSNYWFDSQKNIIYFREGQKKERSIQLSANNGKYQYEGVISDNIYEIIIRTSIFSTIFGSSSDSHVAVTEEALKLPFEEQPWFVGAVDKGELKTIEQADTRMFFTRAKGPKVYLHWTTTKRMKNPERPMLLESNDLSLVLTGSEFITARHNGGLIKHSTEVLFCLRVMQNNLDGAKGIFEQGVNVASLVLREPNLISYYIEHTPQEAINEELILWLLNNSISIDSDDKEIIDTAASKCSDRVIEALLAHGVKNSSLVMRRAVTHNIPPARMRIYFKTFSSVLQIYNSSRTYFEHIKDYRTTDYTNRTLVTLAWRYGNEDNFLRMLPKELIQHIISFGIDDDWPWLDYMDSLDLTDLRHLDYYYRAASLGELVKLAVIGCHYWQKLEDADFDFMFKRLLHNNESYLRTSAFYDGLSSSQMKLLTSWIIKLSTRRPIQKEMFLKSSLMCYLLNNTNSVPVVKSLLDTRTIKREWWLESGDLGDRTFPSHMPISWQAIHPPKPNKPLIQLLIRENLMPEDCRAYNRTIGLSAYLRHHNSNTPEVEAVIEFIRECRQNPNLKLAL